MALIVVQAGHYHRTSGSTGTGGLDGDPTEQEFTWPAANACARLIRGAGHTCRVIHADVSDSSYVGDGFVAIHCDGSTSRDARGASVGYQTSEGKAFADRWKAAYAAEGWAGGWRPDNYTDALAGYYGVDNAIDEGNRRAFILEAGFLTNPANEAALSLPHGPERVARAVARAVVETFGGTPPGGGFLADLTEQQQQDMYGWLKEVFRETAADDDECRLREVTLAARRLLADRRPAGYFAKLADSDRTGLVYWVTADHAAKVTLVIGGALHEHLKQLCRDAGYSDRAEVLEPEVLAEIPSS